MLNKKTITSETPCGAEIRSLYEAAFPRDERIPWADLMRLVDVMPLDFTAYYDNEQFVGFTIAYPRKTFNWFWYFAVKEEFRGRGYGQQILIELLNRYKGQTSVLDMESPYQTPCDNLEQRQRRHRFYLRNGFRDTGVFRSYSDIVMTVMIIGEGDFSIHDWDEITAELKRFWWPDELK